MNLPFFRDDSEGVYWFKAQRIDWQCGGCGRSPGSIQVRIDVRREQADSSDIDPNRER